MSNVLDRVRKLLLQFDCELVKVKGEIGFLESRCDLHKSLNTKKDRRLFILDNDKLNQYKIYYNNLVEGKAKVVSDINQVLKKYGGRYDDIFRLYFIEKRKITEIADRVGYTYDNVKKVIAKLRNELEMFYNF